LFKNIGVNDTDLKGTGLTPLYKKYWQQAGQGGTVGKLNKNKRLDLNRPSHTLQKSEGNGGAYHPTECRALSVKELKAIGSFPDTFKFAGNRRDAIQRIGNSVPPNLMRAIAEHIKKEILNKCPAQ